MHTLQILSCPSVALDTHVPVAVLVPPDHAISGRRYAVLTLLHGLSDKFMCWLDYTNIRLYVDKLRLIVVMPQCGRSFYLNTAGGQCMEDFISRDLFTFIDAQYTTLGTRESRALGGISMGGYGALMLALRHRDVWSMAFSHGGAVGAPQWIQDAPHVPVFGDFGSDIRHEYDVFNLVNKRGEPFPQLHFDCGIDDFLLDENRALHYALQDLAIDHVYRERPGGHTWNYCDDNLQAAIMWVCRYLDGDCDPELEPRSIFE